VEIAVEDTGCGIDPAGMKTLFEPLFTTKPHRVGLGLTLAKRLADLNSAIIRVKSKVGAGSTFSLFLPISRTYE
jgi:signal transduction histidine kinase